MKPRLKMHQFPGDVSKQEKIAMMEKRSTRTTGKGGKKVGKAFRKKVRMKERAVLKRRTQQEIISP